MYRVFEPRRSPMPEWTVTEPTVLDIDEPVTALAVRIVAGHVDVLPTDGPARVEVSEIEHDPLIVTVEDGVLTIRHESLTWDGVMRWLRQERRRAVISVAVPASCAAKIGVVSASAVIAGLDAPVHVRCVSGDVTLDGVTGKVDVESVSGDVEGRALRGRVAIASVSGGVTLVDGHADRIKAKSVSGDVALDLIPNAPDVDITTVSGDVLVRLPHDAAMRVDVASTSGDLSCAFDGATVERKPGSRKMHGSLGDGSGALHGRTVSGRVALLAREPA
jgi:hypothetical protein